MNNKKSDGAQSSDILTSAAKSATYGIGLQMTFRVSTFLVNLILIRYISKDLLGIVNVRLFLLYMTIYGLTSEPFVRAGLSRTQNRCWSQTVNLLWCSLPLGLFWSILCGFVWLYVLEQPDPQMIPNYSLAVICYASSAIVELLCLPLFVVGQLLLFVKARAVIEGSALMCQCFLSVTLVILKPQWGLISFSIAQLLYALVISVLYYGYFFHQIRHRRGSESFPFTSCRDVFPSTTKDKPFVDGQLNGLLWSFARQCFFKQLLTEGEKYVMTMFNVLTFADQGVYNVVNNLGSLVVRILFLPMEDGMYLYVSQNLQRGIPLKQQSQERTETVGSVLSAILRVRVLIGVVIATYGFSYSSLALQVLYGEKFSSDIGPLLLRWISLYVFLVSVNGITEGFKNASMSQDQVDRYNRVMFGFSVAFLGSSLILTKSFGSVGFVLSNCINMLLRILHSAYYIYWYFQDGKQQPVWNHFPSLAMLFSFFITLSFTTSSEVAIYGPHWKLQAIHVAIGILCLLFNAAFFFFFERTLIRDIRSLWFKKEDKTKTH